MAADLLENYEANPRPFQFIKDVPVDWADTVVLNGEIGDFVTIARKDRRQRELVPRRGDRRGRPGAERAAVLPDAGQALPRADLPRRAERRLSQARRKDIVIEERTVTSADVLTLRLAPGGGQAIRFVAAK